MSTLIKLVIGSIVLALVLAVALRITGVPDIQAIILITIALFVAQIYWLWLGGGNGNGNGFGELK